MEETYIQSLDALIKPWFDTLSHQTASTAAAEIVLYALLSEPILLLMK